MSAVLQFLKKRPILVALAAIVAGVVVYVISGALIGYIVYDVFNITFPTDDKLGFVVMVAGWFLPLAFGMLTSFLIASWFWRRKG